MHNKNLKSMKEVNDLKKEFSVELLRDKCNESNSRIYGFILYTKSHPFVIKALKDPDFWNALDDISGPNWPIFSVKPNPQKETKLLRKPCAKMKDVVPVNGDYKKFLKFFGITDMDMLPCFMAFIWDDDGKLRTIACKIASKPETAVYDSLEEIVKIITKVEAKIPEEDKTTELLFQKVEKALKMRNFKYVILDAIQTIKDIKDFIGLFGF